MVLRERFGSGDGGEDWIGFFYLMVHMHSIYKYVVIVHITNQFTYVVTLCVKLPKYLRTQFTSGGPRNFGCTQNPGQETAVSFVYTRRRRFCF